MTIFLILCIVIYVIIKADKAIKATSDALSTTDNEPPVISTLSINFTYDDETNEITINDITQDETDDITNDITNITINDMTNNQPPVALYGPNNGTIYGDVIINGDQINAPTATQQQSSSTDFTPYEDVTEPTVAPSQPSITDDSPEIIAKLTPIFYGDKDKATEFVNDIRHLSPIEICHKVRILVRTKVISELSRNKDLWQILHDYNLYQPTLRNWNKQVM